MSSSIWTRCAGDSEIRTLRVDAWRVVESQHQVATRKLVDSDDEQLLLEQLIERVKPPERTGGRLHYLLFTPFRYPPLAHGSRFGSRLEPGIWYGSETLRTAFAEVAYYRLLFLEGSSAAIGPVQTELTAFRALLRTARGIDLTVSPFSTYGPVLSSPVAYTESQALGRDMRAAGVQAFRYRSARDINDGVNVGAFSADVFGRRGPRALETWHSVATREQVELRRRDYFKRASYLFLRDDFLVNGILPSPAL